jgi:hypothetical protein
MKATDSFFPDACKASTEARSAAFGRRDPCSPADAPCRAPGDGSAAPLVLFAGKWMSRNDAIHAGLPCLLPPVGALYPDRTKSAGSHETPAVPLSPHRTDTMIRFKPKADDAPSPAAKKPPEVPASREKPAARKAAAKSTSRSKAGTAKEADLLDRADDQDQAAEDVSPKH